MHAKTKSRNVYDDNLNDNDECTYATTNPVHSRDSLERLDRLGTRVRVEAIKLGDDKTSQMSGASRTKEKNT